MQKIRDVLHCLLDQKKSQRVTAVICNVARKTVADYLTRFQLAQLPWPLPIDLYDDQLKLNLFPKSANKNNRPDPEIEYALVHVESKKKGFTRSQMYRELVTDQNKSHLISYSAFCRQYKQYKKTLKLSLRRTRIAGEICMVDYAGQTMKITNPKTGVTRNVQIFVGMLGSSNYTFCEASESQRLEDWLGSHVRMFEYFAGTPELVIHDNLKSAVIKTSLYTPLINESYKALCRHYHIHPLAARAYKPRDKGGVELTVQIITRWILFVLRKRVFFSLEELNAEIALLLEDMNHRPFKQLPGSRYSNWQEIEKPTLRSLPDSKYEFAIWTISRAGEDYHVNCNDHYYSVPYTYRNLEMSIRATEKKIEIIYKGKRIASHDKSQIKGGKTTDRNHQPPQHKIFDGWNVEDCLKWAAGLGEHVEQFMRHQLLKVNNRNVGYRVQGAFKKIALEYGNVRLNAACRYALACGAMSTDGIKTILSRNLDSKIDESNPVNESKSMTTATDHENLRGQNYYKNILSLESE
ncbi:IS21 family transposase [Undibacterium sp. CY18W]|uniref:IS21 family transposase n=1 Tax=Undibacterium hunanense TaxID=2762292 RepID=A0ABR6ZW02_9BURK|nr:IS21 family transposase [Undibacterium hunanense]MBC3920045.1 IS21 family transposase [Undibacterium hunanense]